MDLKKVLTISGKSGLFKHITQTRTGVIVESLETKKRLPAFASSKISSLDDISVFTNDEDLPLRDVFKRIYEKENGELCQTVKGSPEEMKEYFEAIVPEYDPQRVYASDMKRVFNWYNQLHEEGMLDFTDEEPNTEDGDDATVEEPITETSENDLVEERDTQNSNTIDFEKED